MEDLTYLIACKQTPLLNFVSQFYAMCSKEFSSSELEEFEVWQRILLDGGESARYVMAVALVVRNSDNKVMGGAALELYRDCSCGLMSYIAVHEDMRGRGVAAALTKYSFEHLSAMCQERLDKPLNALFIEVLQHRDNIEGKFDAKVRQNIWKKLGFVPLDFDLVHPGRLQGRRYNLALMSKVHDPTSRSSFPTSVLLSFLNDLFTGILAEEDRHDREDIEGYINYFGPLTEIPMCQPAWR